MSLRQLVARAVLFAVGTLPAMALWQEPPDWALKTQAVTDPAIVGAANAVVRLDERTLTWNADGYVTEETKTVIEIRRNEGKSFAEFRVGYDASVDKVLEAEAWIVRGGKGAESLPRREWFDLASFDKFTAFDETRSIDGVLSDKAVAGDLAVFHTTIRRRDIHGFEGVSTKPGSLPRAKSTLSITLPEGWKMQTFYTGGLAEIPVQTKGNTTTWEVPPVPYRESETDSVSPDPGLLLKVAPPNGFLFSISTWDELGKVTQQMGKTQRVATPAVLEKLHKALEGVTDPDEKIRSLARLAQGLQYVSINRALVKGHGYRPRSADDVQKTGYGDCKDKANYLKTLLDQIGVKSQMVYIEAEKAATLDERIATPLWFNHAILAIEYANPPAGRYSALFQDEGKQYLLFDPTNTVTLFGDLPDYLQDSKAFIETDTGGHIFKTPALTGEQSFKAERSVHLTLSKDTGAEVDGSITRLGQVAAATRDIFSNSATPEDVEKAVHRALAKTYQSVPLTKKAYDDDKNSGKLHLSFSCTIPTYLQALPGGKFIAKFDVLSREQLPSLPEKTRQTSVYVDPLVVDDQVDMDLGGAFEIAELPKGADIKNDFGNYRLTVEKTDKGLRVFRHYEQFRTTVSPADYAKLKQFFASVFKAERSAAVLKYSGNPAP